ncbi:dynactin subunit 2-like [Mytilus galloprovincialis]|uniref:Dynactin 2 n=3 Tax=Mytilus galloprovincialis TaxID=29158 RepID=A0A8B6GFK9_MYTGA|nr:dynactin 2 [Mytilus galloprovincialis]VDI63178.1 dynactin 2 [Mytilus galloprovincialis]VDI63179.1 dynactin 2 [Mytilus galloprovincialis]VDI63180.1 dynactin 2 [Mytilus galloprovincialis]VDI63181.1 dynactin 2 [Mytilus galloprovincialis]
MADPKYANLPGIDIGAPDVYETDELPEDDQALQTPSEVKEEENESIDKSNIDTSSALGKFKGKDLKASNIDFSDRITSSRRTGYDADKTEYEMLEEGKIETPQQKYQRIQHEIRELAEEANRIKENVKEEANTEKLNPVAFSKQLEYLQHQLSDLQLEKLLGPDTTVNLSDPQGALQKRLMTQLQAYKPVEKSKKSPDGKGEDCVMYELYHRPEQAQFSRNAKMASLEERLDRLEAVIGHNPEKLSILTADTDSKCLLEAVSVVNSKLSLLEPTSLEQVDARLHGVNHKLTQIAEKKTAQENNEKQTKLMELYELVKKWNSVSDTLPQVVDRLVSLKDLHEQALQMTQTLGYLDTAQQEINSSLHSHGDLLKQIQETFKQNTDAIKTNTEKLEQRMKTVQK